MICEAIRNHNAARRGVSLIEVIMVIIVLAAAALSTSVMFDPEWSPRRNVTAVTNDVANALVTARNTAITSQTTVRVQRQRVDDIETLTITEDPGPFRSGKVWVIELGGDATLSGASADVEFRSTGTADRSLQWKIDQSNSSGRVNVAPASGQVTRTLP